MTIAVLAFSALSFVSICVAGQAAYQMMMEDS